MLTSSLTSFGRLAAAGFEESHEAAASKSSDILLYEIEGKPNRVYLSVYRVDAKLGSPPLR
jgi:hypothetical protein